MQSRRKSSSQTNLQTDIKKTSSLGTQTENLPDFDEPCHFNAALNEIKEHYQAALGLLNRCHSFINSVFMGEVGHLKVAKRLEFKVPEVPDYFSLLEAVLEDDVRPKLSEEECRVCDLMQFLWDKSPEGRSEKGSSRGPESKSKSIALEKKIEVNVGGARLIKSGEILERPGRSDMRFLNDKDNEDILRTGNESENKSVERLIKNGIPLNEPPSPPTRWNPTLEQSLGGQVAESADEGSHGCKNHYQPVKSIKYSSNPTLETPLEYVSKNRKSTSENSHLSGGHQLTEDFSQQHISPDVSLDLQGMTKAVQFMRAMTRRRVYLKRANEQFEGISLECTDGSEKGSEYAKEKTEICSCENVSIADEKLQRGRFSRFTDWGKDAELPWRRRESEKKEGSSGNWRSEN